MEIKLTILAKKGDNKAFKGSDGNWYNLNDNVVPYLEKMNKGDEIVVTFEKKGVARYVSKIASAKEVFLKAVICQSTIEEDLREALKLIKEINNSLILVLQPNSYEDKRSLLEKAENFKGICRQEGITACVIPQMHKFLGVR